MANKVLPPGWNESARAAKNSGILTINGQSVPDPAKGGVQITDEPIWSENTGRDVNSGKMLGDIKAWKKTVQITWPPLTFTEVRTILNAIKVTGKNPFYKIRYNDTSASTATEITAYSGNLQRTVESISRAYKRQTGVTITFIEQ